MSNTKLNIPKKLKVGFNNRNDTYTGKLAYVIYYDEKGVLRKEKSWESWRDKKIDPLEIDNEPTSGFVLNRKVGGYAYSWHARQTAVRVFDPRGFEFEISVENLLFILQECSAIKGKGIEGEFVYAWEGTNLVLLPVECQEYQESAKFTSLKTVKIDKKQMVPGRTYLMKDMSKMLYLGREDYYETHYRYFYGYSSEDVLFNTLSVTKQHIFIDLETIKNGGEAYFTQSGFTRIAEVISEDVHPEFVNQYNRFKSGIYGSPVAKVEFKETPYESVLQWGVKTVKDCGARYVKVYTDHYLPVSYFTYERDSLDVYIFKYPYRDLKVIKADQTRLILEDLKFNNILVRVDLSIDKLYKVCVTTEAGVEYEYTERNLKRVDSINIADEDQDETGETYE